MINWILLALAVPMTAGGYLWRRKVVARLAADEPPNKKDKRRRALATILTVIGAYLLITNLISLIFGTHESDMEFSIWAERTDIFGFSVSLTTVYTWIAMGVLVIAALIFRFAVFRRFKDVPRGVQNVLEALVEVIGKYTDSKAHGTGEILCSYILTIGVFMVASAGFELFRMRSPTADITMTFALALITFVLINVYGIKKKGTIGRIKSLASPSPVVFVFRCISEVAIPVSMACRLFGNMLGGMIVMDLLYSALGNGAVGIPSVLGLYFNVFHPLIQAFIFITLTLTFINEAIE